MTVRVFRELEVDELDDAQVVGAVEAALEHGGRPGLGVDVVLLGDAALAELHGRFLGDPSETDVMAFDLGPPDGPAAEGDEREPEAEIYVSAERARAVAAERGLPAPRELVLYLVHGALHLCGHDDHEPAERARMRQAEALVLGRLGFPAERGEHDAAD
jgi:probable rRNA maturation factor